MKKEYVTPEVDLLTINEDVITMSGFGNEPGGAGGGGTPNQPGTL